MSVISDDTVSQRRKARTLLVESSRLVVAFLLALLRET
jgi:hypothetical protein